MKRVLLAVVFATMFSSSAFGHIQQQCWTKEEALIEKIKLMKSVELKHQAIMRNVDASSYEGLKTALEAALAFRTATFELVNKLSSFYVCIKTK